MSKIDYKCNFWLTLLKVIELDVMFLYVVKMTLSHKNLKQRKKLYAGLEEENGVDTR